MKPSYLLARGSWMVSVLMILATVLPVASVFAGHIEQVDVNGIPVQVYIPDVPAARISEDGNTLLDYTPVILLHDPNPPSRSLHIPPPFELRERGAEEAPATTFSISYVAAGGQDPWGQACDTFPEEAKVAFDAAASVWASLLNSNVPITISACWANLGAVSTLGYSGGSPRHHDFANAPQPSTYYKGALANSLAGTDLNASLADMYITYNSNFTWYYGTDGNTPAGQVDLMSVVLHEIAHGLNFSGSMLIYSGSGSWGDGSPYPDVYDTFAYDGSNQRLIDTSVYPNPSVSLGNALTSGSVYFRGTNAMAANGGQPVKLYAPSTWSPGSSYAHLDSSTFAGTVNALMRPSIGSGVSIHDPGPVTMGLFKDLGWSTGTPITLNQALDNALLTFTTLGDGTWYPQSSFSYFGGSAARSGGIANNQSTSLQTTVAGPGTLSFYWKSSSEPNYDFLKVLIDSAESTSISGLVDWTQVTLSVPAGSHTITWQYIKDESVSQGSDCGWVDKVVFTSTSTNRKPLPPIILLMDN